MKRKAVLRRIKSAARKRGLDYREVELTNHTGVIVGGTRSTLGRHAEIADGTARAFFKQFEIELGKGWWR
ncbi:ribonuclease PH [Microbacteriaceae bacterium VKM Ac-2854]|nr:ribonuclease PH [Microbacteriaceae bacterium VKM Ac-2854]